MPYVDDNVLEVNAGLTINRALLPSSLVLAAMAPQCCQVKGIFHSRCLMYTDQRGMKQPDGNEQFSDIGAYEYMDSPTCPPA